MIDLWCSSCGHIDGEDDEHVGWCEGTSEWLCDDCYAVVILIVKLLNDVRLIDGKKPINPLYRFA